MATRAAVPGYLESFDREVVEIAAPLMEKFYPILDADRKAGLSDRGEAWKMAVDSITKAAVMAGEPVPESRDGLLDLVESYREMDLEEMEPVRRRLRNLLDAYRMGVF